MRKRCSRKMSSMSDENPPRRERRGRIRLPVALLLAVCLGAAAFLGFLGVAGFLEQRTGTAYYGSLAASVRVTAGPEASPEPEAPEVSPGLSAPPTAQPRGEDGDAADAPSREGNASARQETAGTDSGEQTLPDGPEATPAPHPAESPEAGDEDQPVIAPVQESADELSAPKSELDFEMLCADCPDVVGWIRIEGTVIDYPIVQGEDNVFYLKHLPEGTPNAAGSIMMDEVNAPDFSDDVTILHGHHMRSGAMFGDIDEYKHVEYYLEHPMMRLFTPDGDYDVAVFAAYSVDGATFAYPTVFSGEEGFEEFLHRALTRTPWTADVDVQYGDRLLMLSTCAYAYENERFLVVGKILDGTQENE